jgi:hypothetical protein
MEDEIVQISTKKPKIAMSHLVLWMVGSGIGDHGPSALEAVGKVLNEKKGAAIHQHRDMGVNIVLEIRQQHCHVMNSHALLTVDFQIGLSGHSVHRVVVEV